MNNHEWIIHSYLQAYTAKQNAEFDRAEVRWGQFDMEYFKWWQGIYCRCCLLHTVNILWVVDAVRGGHENAALQEENFGNRWNLWRCKENAEKSVG